METVTESTEKTIERAVEAAAQVMNVGEGKARDGLIAFLTNLPKDACHTEGLPTPESAKRLISRLHDADYRQRAINRLVARLADAMGISHHTAHETVTKMLEAGEIVLPGRVKSP